MRIGFGCDIHPFDETKPLFLGGVFFPSCCGLKGHSDADVILHAVCDALLGAASLGDIGEHFPDTDARYKGIDSTKLLEAVILKIEDRNYNVENIDITVIAEKPKITPQKENMKTIIAGVCKITKDQVNLKATTSEKLGFVGRGEGIVAYAVAALKPAGVKQ